MDTGTHFVMGLGLFGLAHLDPAVTAHQEASQAFLIATVVGSQIPDADTLYRFGGNAAYIRNHRGWSHSLPMLFAWPTLITWVLSMFFTNTDWKQLWFWTFVAVFIHIFIDLFNTYGTQALRPLSSRWVSWNVINIFDPFIFALHLVGFLLWWALPQNPGYTFSLIYLFLIAYIGWRSWIRYRLVSRLKQELNEPGRYTVTPTVHWNVWNVIVEQPHRVKMGEIRGGQLFWTGQLSTKDLDHPAVIHSKKADSIDAFLSFTSYGYPQVFSRPYGYEVRWLDVRYHYKKHFPFVAVALLDSEYTPFHSFVGWMSEDQLEKKVQHLLS
ncbi:metal-dependent hydrolase [Paenactinomyces guangxiensis]|uniref:Metal-dependent hydrolase n=1 Tax=Paenactinomyces guangxiensis TaxID=1490290 RepID=A0A7W2A9P4_9BACL|nr:metal-dependent hydrolase [Paenactinomyces guangxiensis]MBA4495469.1 metal-dependent hydrolase [Paenactinomyces guangxiensis]MBH8592408.1 metal-dependent hydrolase [Paenactinomyces guangxiensis]